MGRRIYLPIILTNDFESDITDVVEFHNLRGGKERILDDMNNGFGWKHLPKSFMAENAVYLLMTALIRNFYKTIIRELNVKDLGLSITNRIKTFVFKYISVAAKWIRTSRTYMLSIYTENPAYKKPFNRILANLYSRCWVMRIASNRFMG